MVEAHEAYFNERWDAASGNVMPAAFGALSSALHEEEGDIATDIIRGALRAKPKPRRP
jgi:hypothetical protein